MSITEMDYTLQDYHLRPPSRRTSPSRRDYKTSDPGPWAHGFMNGVGGKNSNNPLAAPSAAVRRALQVLDESYKQQKEHKSFSPWPNHNRASLTTSPVRSRSASPVRKVLRSSPTFSLDTTPPRIIEIERDNLQDALGDSETRRNVLLRKLAETQRTMQIQNDTLRTGEIELGNSKATVKLMQQVQEELETKLKYLEKEKQSYINRSMQDAEEKETLRRLGESLQHEVKRLQCQLDLLLADKEREHEHMNRANEEIKALQENTKKLLETKSVWADEISTLRENLDISKQKSGLLEKEKDIAFNDLSKIQESQQALVNRNTELSDRVNYAENTLVSLRNKLEEAEISLHNYEHDIQTYTEKYAKQGYKLAELQTTQKELKNDLERSNRYNFELEKTLQSVKVINQQMKENKVTLEDNLTGLHADLAKTRLDLCRVTDERTRLSEDLEAAKKNQRHLNSDLEEVRRELVTKDSELLRMEATKKTGNQKMSLLETQKNQAEREIEELSLRSISQQEAYDNLKLHLEENSRSTSKQIRELKSERDKMEDQYKETESRLERMNLKLAATTEHDQSQLDHWRETCTKLTTLIEERDHDLRESTIQLRLVEDSFDRSEAQRKPLELQISAMHEMQLELNELKSNNKQLVQEGKENQQMIAVLEIERNVLAKSPSRSTSHDGTLEAEVKKLQNELSMVLEKLTTADSIKEKMNKINHHERDLDDLLGDLKTAQDSNKLLGDQLAQVKKEADTMRNLMKARTDTYDREIRKMERERERLESRTRSLEEEARVLRSSLSSSAKSFGDSVELRNMRLEVDRLKQDLEVKDQQYLTSKGQLVIAQNSKKTAEDRVMLLDAQIEKLKQEKLTLGWKSLPGEKEELEKLRNELQTKKAKLEDAEAASSILQSRLHDLSEARDSQENHIKTMRIQLKEIRENAQRVSSDQDSKNSDGSTRSATIELASIRRDLQRAYEDIALRDQQMAELKGNLVLAQKQEQKAKQERDELKGKTIIMESITDSSTDLRKELDQVLQEKSDLEKQMHSIVSSKPIQTLPSDLSITEDCDREMEKQYKIVCDRNKWLENRIASLLREIDLLRDQNSLLLEEKNTAERQAEVMQGELKNVTMTSKSSRQQKELEHIHLQNSNAEKMQKMLELQREMREKNQLIQAMSKQLEAAQKKTDKKKISAFMKKLRKSSVPGNFVGSPKEKTNGLHSLKTEPSTLRNSSTFPLLPSGFTTQSLTDVGYSTLSVPGEVHDEMNQNINRSRSTPGDISRLFQASQTGDWIEHEDSHPRATWHRDQEQETPAMPETMKGLSPSPSQLWTGRKSETGNHPHLHSPNRTIEDIPTLPDPPRKIARNGRKRRPNLSPSGVKNPFSEDESESETESEENKRGGERKRSYSLERPIKSRNRRVKRAVMSADELDELYFDPERSIAGVSDNNQSHRSTNPMPESDIPNPAPAPFLPTPASSPSVLSLPSARNPAIPIYATSPRDEHQASKSEAHSYETSNARKPERTAVRKIPSPRPNLPSPEIVTGTPVKSRSSKTQL